MSPKDNRNRLDRFSTHLDLCSTSQGSLIVSQSFIRAYITHQRTSFLLSFKHNDIFKRFITDVRVSIVRDCSGTWTHNPAVAAFLFFFHGATSRPQLPRGVPFQYCVSSSFKQAFISSVISAFLRLTFPASLFQLHFKCINRDSESESWSQTKLLKLPRSHTWIIRLC